MSPRDVRDAAVVVLARLGLKLDEIAGLALADVLDRGEVRTCIEVEGSRRTRVVALDRLAAVCLRAWVDLRGRRPGALVLAVHVDAVGWRGLEPPEVEAILHRRRGAPRRARAVEHDDDAELVDDLAEATP